ncbi:DUF7503 family protein [Halorussus litoreus]
MAQSTSVKDRLAEYPRIMGALFTITCLLVQAGAVVASSGSPKAGP